MADSPVKGFKLTDASRSKTCGVGCKSFEELVSKSRKKFKLSDEEKVSFFLQDGTLVESQEYFSTLPAQTKLILAKSDEPIMTEADIIYETLKAVNEDVLKAGSMVERFFSDKIKDKVRILSKLTAEKSQGEEDARTLKSSRSEHPEWFEGLDTSCKTKEAYMGRRCADRMRGYLSKTREELRKSRVYKEGSQDVRAELESALTYFMDSLRELHFMAFYFNRASDLGPLCDRTGVFLCSGTWSVGRCEHLGGLGHRINPYASREERLLFSTWNLDHRIERARSVVPAILEAASLVASSKPPSLRLNANYFFELLFTRKNLGLVHIVCHDKGSHGTASCDKALVTVRLDEEIEGAVEDEFSQPQMRLVATASPHLFSDLDLQTGQYHENRHLTKVRSS